MDQDRGGCSATVEFIPKSKDLGYWDGSAFCFGHAALIDPDTVRAHIKKVSA